MNPVNLVQHTPLTQTDITRLPQNALNQPKSMPDTGNDVYGYGNEKKSSWKGIAFTVAAIAAAIVALKRFGQNSFMKIADPNNMKLTDKVKNIVIKTADGIEYPFVKSYKFIKSKINGKTADAANDTVKPQATTEVPTPAPAPAPAPSAG